MTGSFMPLILMLLSASPVPDQASQTKNLGKSRVEDANDVERLREIFRQEVSTAEQKIVDSFAELRAQLVRSGTPDLETRLRRLDAAIQLFEDKGVVPSYLGKESKAYLASVGKAATRLTRGIEETARTLRAQGESEGADRLEQESKTLATKLASIAAGLRFPASGELVVMPTAETGPGWEWDWTTSQPALGWYSDRFQPVGWSRGRAAFGRGASNTKFGTIWATGQIWLRTKFDAPEIYQDDIILIRHRHDDELELYTDAGPVLTLPWYNSNYEMHCCSNEEVMKLAVGAGRLAATCKQTGGSQAFDIGIVILRDAARDPRLNPLSRNESIWLTQRGLTDPRLRISVDIGTPKLHVNYFKSAIDRWAEFRLDGDIPYLDRALGRNKLICSHPHGKDAPASLDFSELTRDGRGVLQIWVHSWPGRGDGGSLLIKVDDRIIHQQHIKPSDGWQRVNLPFDHQRIIVEHMPVGWNMEYLFFDYCIIPRK